MGEIVNLNRKRKAVARQRREAEAAENRVKFGRTRAEKRADKAEGELEARRLDGHRRETGDDQAAGGTTPSGDPS